MKFEIWYSQKELSYLLIAEDATPRMRHFLCNDYTLIETVDAANYASAKKVYDVKRKAHWQMQLERGEDAFSGE
jgi:hypothetical protein